MDYFGARPWLQCIIIPPKGLTTTSVIAVKGVEGFQSPAAAAIVRLGWAGVNGCLLLSPLSDDAGRADARSLVARLSLKRVVMLCGR